MSHQIATFRNDRGKGAIRDVGRDVKCRSAKYLPLPNLFLPELNITLERALKESSDFRRLYDEDESARGVIDLARRIEGLPRNISINAAGVVIAEGAACE